MPSKTHNVIIPSISKSDSRIASYSNSPITKKEKNQNPRQVLSERIREAGLTPDRFIKLQEGSKAPVTHDTHLLTEVEAGNYGVYPDHGLVMVDVDSTEDTVYSVSLSVGGSIKLRVKAVEIPSPVEQLPETFTTSSPHGGEHRYYAVEGEGEISNSKREWGEIRAERWYVAGPGSELTDCDKKWHDCSGTGEGHYTIKHDRPIATISASELPEETTSDKSNPSPSDEKEITGELPDYDEELVAVGKQHLKSLQGESPDAFKCLMDRLKGGRGRMGDKLNRENAEGIDRSATDFVTVSHLYGVMSELGSEDSAKAQEIAYAVYTHYAEEHQWMKDGHRRNWHVENQEYRKNIVQWAINEFDRGKFQRWLNQHNSHSNEWEGWTDEYSETTYNSVRFALKWLAGDLPMNYDILTPDKLHDMALTFYGLDVDRDVFEKLTPLQNTPTHISKDSTPPEGCILRCEYPTKGRVIEVAKKLDGNHNAERSYDEALNRLRRDGIAVMACLKEGVDYRYYYYGLPHPDGVEYVRTEGEKYEP